MNLEHNDIIAPHIVGTFIRDLLEIIVNKKSSIPGITYTYDSIRDFEFISFYHDSLILGMPPTFRYEKLRRAVHFIALDNSTIFFENINVSRSEVHEQIFALSTVLNDKELYNLECTKYFSDINLGTSSSIYAIKIDSISYYLSQLHTCHAPVKSLLK